MRLASDLPPKANLQPGEDFQVNWLDASEAIESFTYDDPKDAVRQALRVDRGPSRTLALASLLLPVATAVGSLILFIIVNMLLNPTFWMTPDAEPVAETPVVITLINGVLLSLGAIGLVAFIPGVILGIILLARRSRNSR